MAPKFLQYIYYIAIDLYLINILIYFLFCNIFIFKISFIRDIAPKNGQEVFFSRELYEKYSLSPSLSELWLLSNRYIVLPFCALCYHPVDTSPACFGESCLSGTQGFVTDSWGQLLAVLYLL